MGAMNSQGKITLRQRRVRRCAARAAGLIRAIRVTGTSIAIPPFSNSTWWGRVARPPHHWHHIARFMTGGTLPAAFS